MMENAFRNLPGFREWYKQSDADWRPEFREWIESVKEHVDREKASEES